MLVELHERGGRTVGVQDQAAWHITQVYAEPIRREPKSRDVISCLKTNILQRQTSCNKLIINEKIVSEKAELLNGWKALFSHLGK